MRAIGLQGPWSDACFPPVTKGLTDETKITLPWHHVGFISAKSQGWSFWVLLHEANDSHVPGFSTHIQQGQRHGKLKSLWASAARIQIEHPVAFRLLCLMSVTADDRLESSGLRAKIQFPQVVQHVKTGAPQFHHCRHWQFLRPGFRVNVSAHGKNRRDSLQLRKYFWVADVARMNDHLDAFQRALCLRPQ